MKIVKHFILILCIISFSGLNAQTQRNYTFSVEGTVTNAATKKPISGVKITFKDLKSTLTDESGNFKIMLPSGDVSLLVSAPLYTSRKVAVKGRNKIEIVMYNDDFKSSYPTIAVPNGEKSKLNATDSWVANNDNNILSTSITGESTIQGKVSGVNMIQHSGALAAGSNVFIRGLNTMNAGTQPLYIVDGMPYENSIYSTSLLGNYFSNPLASIDAKDIESVTVLKDGTSQYGTKGANGVILIRTLKAKEMETKINFHYHFGLNMVPQELPVLNASDNKLLMYDILQSQGLSSTQIMSKPYMDPTKPTLEKWGYEGNVDYYRYNNNTNWQNQVFNQSTNQNYYLNVFGGDEVAVYALAIGYMQQGGIVTNTDFERFNTRFNAKVNMSKKLEFNANMSFLFSNKNLIDEGAMANRNPIFGALTKSPFMASHIYNPEGAVSPVIEDADIFNNSNPYSLVNTSDRANSLFRFVGNFEGVYKLNKYIRMNALVGVNFNKEREKVYFPNRGVFFETVAAGEIDNQTQHRVDRLFSIYTEANINYNRTLNIDHEVGLNLGFRSQINKAEDDWAKTANTGSDNFKSISYGDPLFRVIGGQISNWNWQSLYGSAEYGYKEKLFANLTVSADASSRYGFNVPALKLFPALSGAWLLSNEEFMKDVQMIDILKLRIGYGISGNDDIGNYSGIQYYIPQNLLGNYGLVRGNLVDLNISPEISNKATLGIDLSMLKERLSIGIELFQNRIDDMILRIPANKVTGFSYYLTNAGKMKNTGVDLSVNARILNTKLKWDAGFNASIYKNKVTDLQGQEYITNILGADVLTRVGESVGVFYGYKTEGVYATQAEADAAGLSIQKGSLNFPFNAGDVKFVNTDNSDKIINENDKVIIGNPNPDVYGSVFTNLKYNNWTLNAFFTYSIGNDIYNYTRAQLESMSNYNNQTQAVINRWKTEGDITTMPKAVYGDPMGNARFSDRWVEDGSYIRLKSLTLSYDLRLKSKVVNSCTFYTTADNLFLLTKYKGLDPEFALGTSPLYNGIDATFTPMVRTISFGVKLEL